MVATRVTAQKCFIVILPYAAKLPSMMGVTPVWRKIVVAPRDRHATSGGATARKILWTRVKDAMLANRHVRA
jgi:hypothetical protein